MATEIEDGFVYQTCNQCPHIERKKREDIGLFWLNGRPRCSKCGANYAVFGFTRHGDQTFDDNDLARLSAAMRRHGLSPTDSSTHSGLADSEAKMDPAYHSPDPRDWPRTGQPLRPPSDPDEEDGIY